MHNGLPNLFVEEQNGSVDDTCSTTPGTLAALAQGAATGTNVDGVMGDSPLLTRLPFDLEHGNGKPSSCLLDDVLSMAMPLRVIW